MKFPSALLAIAFMPFPAAQGVAASTIVIVDGTAQMAQTLGQRRKIEWLKTALPAAIQRSGPDERFSLWLFGGDPSLKCESVKRLLPPIAGPGVRSAIDGAAAAIEPKPGRSPVLSTLRAALKSDPENEKNAVSLVVISGTGDDCGEDLCSSARALSAIYPKARLSAIGVGMSPAAADSFGCAAKAMRGSFTQAKSGSDLEKLLRAALETVPAAGAKTGSPETAPPPTKSPAVKPQPPAVPAAASSAAPETVKEAVPGDEDAEGEKAQPPAETPPPAVAAAPPPQPNVTLSAILAAGSPSLEEGVTWRISKIAVSPTGQAQISDLPVWTGGGGPARMKLLPGRYSVGAQYGLASATAELTVTDNATLEKAIALDAGVILVRTLETPGGEAADGAFVTVSGEKPGHGRQVLSRSSLQPAQFYLNTGTYSVSASVPLHRIETPVTVQPGKISAVTLVLDIGTLELNAVAVEGSTENLTAVYRIARVENAAAANETAVLISSAPAARLRLPAGTYRVQTDYGQARHEETIRISRGSVTRYTAVLNTGQVTLAATPDSPGENGYKPVCAVFAGGSAKTAGPIARAAGPHPSFILKAGLYEIECQRGAAASPTARTAFEVVAGKTNAVELPR